MEPYLWLTEELEDAAADCMDLVEPFIYPPVSPLPAFTTIGAILRSKS